LDDEPPLRVVNIEAGYGRARVVGEVSLAVDAGEIVALLGPNGAGKSTLLSAVSGLLLPFAGQVMLCGKDVSRAGPREGRGPASRMSSKGAGSSASCPSPKTFSWPDSIFGERSGSAA
jgi:ABC-type cobalamin/Fe3+-siderophores transport system ATPase subunit